jgi:hypothetical protein
MVERYIKTIEEHLRKVVTSHQRDWDEGLPPLSSSYRASTHDTTGLTAASPVFGRELPLPCDLLFGVPPDKEIPTSNYCWCLVTLAALKYKRCCGAREAVRLLW